MPTTSINVPRIRASQGNRAHRRHAAKLTHMKAPRGTQDNALKVVKLVNQEATTPCKNKGCDKPRQQGSSRCKSCAQPVVTGASRMV